MEDENAVPILNDLLNREQCGLASRLMGSTMFVSVAGVEAHELVRRLAREAKENASLLTDLILRLGGALGPRRINARMAELHFQEVRHLLPILLTEHEALVGVYESASARLASLAGAAALVGRILSSHREGRSALHQILSIQANRVSA